MSVQYGVWHFDGKALDPEEFRQAEVLLAPYAPDGLFSHVEPSLGMIYGSFHTTAESRGETQPYVLPSGAVLVWDGRLDNRTQLIRMLGNRCVDDLPDVEIVAACYRQWELARLDAFIGDWSLTLWEPNNRTLVLAKDFLGTRHLYYRLGRRTVAWSTVLDPLVHSPKDSLSLCDEYLAGCLSSLPAPYLTPYNEIASLPPSSYVLVNGNGATSKKYWDFDPRKSIRYRTDSDYERHFLEVFRQAVLRRLRCDASVLAELSGGMDSSSIVCVADDLLATNVAAHRPLQTMSYFSSSEPDWDEAPYFATVEERRRRVGFHVNLGTCGFFRFGYDTDALSLSPSAGPRTRPDKEIDDFLQSSGHRVLLSGIGGDEFLGGLPTPTPELADLVAGFEFSRLAHQLKQWALAQRKPWLHLIASACRDFLPTALRTRNASERPAPWICAAFAKHHRDALAGYPGRIRLFGTPPSFQHAVGTVDVLRRSLAWFGLSPSRPCEKRYPYLDRCLLEFLFAIPREQLVRPGQRRSLMRRAMRGIVPDEVITRKRKAFVARAPLAALASEWDQIATGSPVFISDSLGIANQADLLRAMQHARAGREVPLLPLVRMLALECWLRQLLLHKICDGLAIDKANVPSIPARTFPRKKGGETHEIRKARSCRIG
jgi:asparagine synthase (glutamine-hydrolysing)